MQFYPSAEAAFGHEISTTEKKNITQKITKNSIKVKYDERVALVRAKTGNRGETSDSADPESDTSAFRRGGFKMVLSSGTACAPGCARACCYQELLFL